MNKTEVDEVRRVIRGLMHIARVAMPDTHYESDSRLQAARRFLKTLKPEKTWGDIAKEQLTRDRSQSPMFCCHANEVPYGGCPCKPGCYCHEHTCKKKTRRTK